MLYDNDKPLFHFSVSTLLCPQGSLHHPSSLYLNRSCISFEDSITMKIAILGDRQTDSLCGAFQAALCLGRSFTYQSLSYNQHRSLLKLSHKNDCEECVRSSHSLLLHLLLLLLLLLLSLLFLRLQIHQCCGKELVNLLIMDFSSNRVYWIEG